MLKYLDIKNRPRIFISPNKNNKVMTTHSKKSEYIQILLDGDYNDSDLTFLNSLSTEQLRAMITREDDMEFVEMEQTDEVLSF